MFSNNINIFILQIQNKMIKLTKIIKLFTDTLSYGKINIIQYIMICKIYIPRTWFLQNLTVMVYKNIWHCDINDIIIACFPSILMHIINLI